MKRLAALLLLLAGCGDRPRDPSQWPIALDQLQRREAPADPGEAAYRRTCIACHAADGKGNGGTTGADFTAADGVLTQGDDRLRVSIREGKRGAIGVMPAHRGLLSEAELDAVLVYVRATFGAGIAVRDAGVADGSTPDAALTP